MDNATILNKAMKKAVKNGYKHPFLALDRENVIDRFSYHYGHSSSEYYDTKEYYPFIFSHDFAKAFWGRELSNCDCVNDAWCPECFVKWKWQLRLQEMATVGEPLKYVEKFL